MNWKKTAKSIGVIASAAAMVAAPAAALTLADYPQPFVKDGVMSGKIVVGAAADTEDVIGAIDIAASLQASAKSAVSTGGTTVAVTGGKSEEIALGGNLAAATVFGSSLDDGDLAGLQDTKITIDIDGDDDEFDVHDEVTFTSSARVDSGLTTTNQDEDFGTGVYLLLAKDSIGYRYVFDDALDAAHYLTNASSSDPITIDFLGNELKITGATATSLTVQVGDEEFMTVGESVEIAGKTVTLENVASGSSTVIVDVDGTTEQVSGTETVNGLRIKVDSTFYADALSERSATLIMGEDATKTYTNDDEYIGEDSKDPDWVWVLSGLNSSSPTIGIDWNQVIDDPDDEGLVQVGEEFALPGEYATILLDSFNQDEYNEYLVEHVTGESLYDAAGTEFETSAKAIRFHADGGDEDGFQIGAYETDDVYVWYNSTAGDWMFFYKDYDDANKIKHAHTVLNATVTDVPGVINVTFKDTAMGVDLIKTADEGSGSVGNFSFDEGTTDLMFYVETSGTEFEYLGHSDGDTNTAGDVYYGSKDISGWDEDTRTAEGIIVYSYDDSASRDELVLDVPEEVGDFMVNIVAKGPGTTVASASTGGSYVVNPIAVGLAVLDSDVSLGSTNLLVVGGPCANDVAAELMGNPVDCAEGFEAGKATIKLYESQNALLVAGGTAQDTIAASRVLADFGDYDLTGDEVEVVAPSLSDITVNAVG